MEIKRNISSQYLFDKQMLDPKPIFKSSQQSALSNSDLPAINTADASLVNANLPVSYTKIGEFEIPGLKDKASVFKLANGQRVIIAPTEGQTVVKTAYNVGSMNEHDDIRGISHFIEHNLFNGSKNLAPREYDKIISALGASTNANTSFATTNYFINLQLLEDNSLEEAIRLNSLQTQFPTFPTEQLEKEKEPVKSEIDMYKDMPSDVAQSQVLKDLFNVHTTSTDFIIGTKHNINSLTRETVLEYYNTWYTPDNAVTVITGDVDTDETMKLVSRYYNKQNDYSNINKRYSEPIKYNTTPQRKDIIMPNATSAHISMGFAIPEGTSKADTDKLDLLFELLSVSDSSLLKAIDKTNSTIQFDEQKIQNKPLGAKARMIDVDTPEENVEEVLRILYEEIAYIANNPPSAEKLERLKQQRINYISSLSESSIMLNNIISDMALENNYNFWSDTIANIKKTTPQDISDAAKKFLDLNKIAICVSHEKTATAASIQNNYNMSRNSQKIVSFSGNNENSQSINILPPSASEYYINNSNAPAFNVQTESKHSKNPLDKLSEKRSKVKEFRLNNNIETTIIPGNKFARPIFKINYNSDELNSTLQSSFAVLTRLLERGSAYRNNDIYNSVKAEKDIDFNIFAGIDGITISGSFNENNLADNLSLIKETLMYPNFSQEEFELAKQYVKNMILSEEVCATDNIFRELFPTIKQYATKEQRLKELESLTLDDIKKLYSHILSTSQVHASLTANTDENPYLQDIFNNELSTGFGSFKPYSLTKSSSYHIYKPNTQAKTLTQADERIQAGIVRAYTYPKTENIDDIAKITVLNTILGGSMSSRLFKALREEAKLAYSTSSYIIDNKDTAVILLDVSTSTDSSDPEEGSPENITKALKGFEDIVNSLKSETVSEEELQNTKAMIKTQLLDGLETNTGRSFSYGTKKDSYYGINFNEALFEAIDKLTPDDIRSAANYVFKNQPVTSIVASQKTLDTLNLE